MRSEIANEVAENFLYELFYIPNKDKNGTWSYFSDETLENCIEYRLKQLNHRNAVLLLSSCDLLNKIIQDIRNRTPLALRLLQDYEEETIDSFEILKDDYLKVAKEIVEKECQKETHLMIIPKITEEDILVVKVGTDDRPASSEDIQSVVESMEKVVKNKDTCIVTHHAINFSILKRSMLKNAIVCSGETPIKEM